MTPTTNEREGEKAQNDQALPPRGMAAGKETDDR